MHSRLPSALIAVVVVLSSGIACSRPQPSAQTPAPDRFRLHVDDLYAAGKEFEAVTTVTKDDEDRLRRIVERVHLHYSFARDWTSNDEQQKLVRSFGEALPAMRVCVTEAADYKIWAGMAQKPHEAQAGKQLIQEAIGHKAKAVEAIEQAVAQLKTANALYVEYRRRSAS